MDGFEEAKARGRAWRKEHNEILQTFEALQHHDVAIQAVFWVSPNTALDGDIPFDVVMERSADVLRAAKLFGEQGCV